LHLIETIPSDASNAGGSVMELDKEEPVRYHDDVCYDSDEEEMIQKGSKLYITLVKCLFLC